MATRKKQTAARTEEPAVANQDTEAVSGVTLRNINTPCEAYDRYMLEHDLIFDLLGGERRMKQVGQKWLPREEGESDPKYKLRLESSYLEPVFEDGINDIVGKLLAGGVVLNEDFPAQARAWCENIDRNGNQLGNWVFTFAFNGVSKSRCGILVEMPKAEQPLQLDGVTPRKFTDEEVKKLGLRPYFVMITPDRLIDWKTEEIAGRERYVQLRIRECVEDTEDTHMTRWNRREVEQVRVLEPGYWWVFRKNGKGEWYEHAVGVTGLDEIPYVDFFPKGRSAMDCRPMFDALSRLNLRIWQSESDLANAVHAVMIPFLFGAGFDPKDPNSLVVATDRVVRHASKDAKLSYVEHTGKAIETGDKYVQSLLERARQKAMEPSISKPQPNTATGEMRAELNMTSDLKIMSVNLQNTLEEAFQYAFKLGKIAHPATQGSLTLPRNFGLVGRPVSDLTVLQGMANAPTPALSPESVFEGAKARGMFPEEHTWQMELERLKAAMPPPPADDGTDDEEDLQLVDRKQKEAKKSAGEKATDAELDDTED